MWGMCLQLWRLAPEEHTLLVVQHHTITDGLSRAVLARDLAVAYNAACSCSAPQWLPLPAAYVDYAAWQRKQMTPTALESELSWWKHTLKGAPALLELPTDRPRPSVMSFAGAELRFSVPVAVLHSLQQLAATHQTTLFVVLVAALQAGAP